MRYETIKTDDLKTGLELPAVIKTITQEQINAYARASGDFNPIHIDPAFAAKTPLGGTIAHGMMIIAYISQMMTAAFGKVWLSSGKLNVRFRSPARPGDTITAAGKITSIENQNDALIAHFDVYCQNQKSEQIITGEAIVKV